MRAAVDLSLARDGYLCDAHGTLRYVWSLDRIMADAIAAGVRVFWDPTLDAVGYTYCWSRVVLLAPWLIEEDPWRIRGVLAEEVAHCVVGPSEERAHRWMGERYSDLLEPIWA